MRALILVPVAVILVCFLAYQWIIYSVDSPVTGVQVWGEAR